MEQGVGVVVEMEVKEVNLELVSMGASIPVVVHSIKVVDEYMDEMVGWLIGNGN